MYLQYSISFQKSGCHKSKSSLVQKALCQKVGHSYYKAFLHELFYSVVFTTWWGRSYFLHFTNNKNKVHKGQSYTIGIIIIRLFDLLLDQHYYYFHIGHIEEKITAFT
jgi:hypothetical protein